MNNLTKEFLPFEEARAFARTLGLKYWRDWRDWRSNRPANIPSNPQITYKNKGFIDIYDWLGSERFDKGTNFKKFNAARSKD